MNDPKKPRITVEDLLRLKRAERPPAEFWARFDAQIREKQLAAIVGRRPWWQGLSGAFVGLRPLPIAAAAGLLAWAGLRYGNSPSPSLAAVRQASAPAPRSVRPERTLVSAPAAPAAQERSAEVAAVQSQAPTPVQVAVQPSSGGLFAETVAFRLAGLRSAPASQGIDPFDTDREFEAAPVSHQTVSEPLARLDPASEERRARLLDAALPLASRILSGEHSRNRVADERMYESTDRFESSDRVSLAIRF